MRGTYFSARSTQHPTPRNWYGQVSVGEELSSRPRTPATPSSAPFERRRQQSEYSPAGLGGRMSGYWRMRRCGSELVKKAVDGGGREGGEGSEGGMEGGMEGGRVCVSENKRNEVTKENQARSGRAQGGGGRRQAHRHPDANVSSTCPRSSDRRPAHTIVVRP